MFGVSINKGVTASGVSVLSSVGVAVFIPTSVGVVVKVNVGVIGVDVGISVGMVVDVAARVGVGPAPGINWPNEQAGNKMAPTKNKMIFFI